MQASQMPWPICEWNGAPVATMSAEERCGWAELLSTAWHSPDCTVAATDAELAAASKLGDAWPTSLLKARLARWFTPVGQRLVCKLLLPDHAKSRRWREKSRQGGIRSGAARRAKGALRAVRVEPPFEPAVKGASNGGSIHHSNEEGWFGKGGSTTNSDGGVSLWREPELAETTVATAEPNGASDDEPPFDSSWKGGSMPTGENDESQGHAESCDAHLEAPLPRGSEGQTLPPPTPPLCGDVLSEKFPLVEGGPGETQSSPLQVDLAGKRIRPAKMTEADLDSVIGLIQFYLTRVGPSRVRAGRKAQATIYARLREGFSVEDLEKAVIGYASDMDAQERVPDFRKTVGNFFKHGPDGVDLYVKGGKAPQIAQDASGRLGVKSVYDGFAALVDAKSGNPCPVSWFPSAAARHAERFSFNKPGDPAELATWLHAIGMERITEAEFERASLDATRTAFFLNRDKPLNRAQHRYALFQTIQAARRSAAATEAARRPPDDVKVGDDWHNSPLRARMLAQQEALAKRAQDLRNQPRAAPAGGAAHDRTDRGPPM